LLYYEDRGNATKQLDASYLSSLAFILSCYFIDVAKPRTFILHCLSMSPACLFPFVTEEASFCCFWMESLEIRLID